MLLERIVYVGDLVESQGVVSLIAPVTENYPHCKYKLGQLIVTLKLFILWAVRIRQRRVVHTREKTQTVNKQVSYSFLVNL